MNQLNITDRTITYNHQIINNANISSLDLKETVPRKNSLFSNFLMVITIGILLMGFSLFSLNRISPDEIAQYLSYAMFAIGALFSYFYWIRNKAEKRIRDKKIKYILYILTNSGSLELFSNSDYDFINSIRLKIQEALNANLGTMNVTYNLDNKTVINSPQGNVVINNVQNYTGLSDVHKEYITDYFEPALEQLETNIKASANEELKRNFEMLKSELNTKTPRKAILQTAFESLKGLANVSELSEAIEKGLQLFY